MALPGLILAAIRLSPALAPEAEVAVAVAVAAPDRRPLPGLPIRPDRSASPEAAAVAERAAAAVGVAVLRCRQS